MTDVELLEEGFDRVAGYGAEAMDVFYDILFEIGLAHRFESNNTDMAAQKPKLLKVLILLRKSARDLPALLPALRTLGQLHKNLGILPHEYLAAGWALVEAFDRTAKNHGFEAWAERYGAAWTQVYVTVMDVMVHDDDTRVRYAAVMQKLPAFVDHHNQLVDDFRRYNEHALDCRVRQFFRLRCTCGLDTIRAQLGDTPTRVTDFAA